MDEGNIDRNRIIDEHLVSDEYFCPVCQCILWKPRSCAKCRHLFCEICINTWLKNPNSAKRCPFRCDPYEEQSCPSDIYSFLSTLNIHCRNSSFGCTKIVPYNLLEQHENIECEYLTERCVECEQLVLISKLDEHRDIPGLCVSRPIKCTVCQTYIEKPFFKDHFHECFKRKMDATLVETFQYDNIQTTEDIQQRISTQWLKTFLNCINIINLLEQQRQLSQVPTNLIGIDAVRKTVEQRRGFFYRIFVMLIFILANGSKAPFFILAFSCLQFLQCVGTLIILYSVFMVRCRANLYRCCYSIMLFSYILTNGTLLIFRFVSDSLIIYLFALFLFLYGCSTPLPLELFEMHPLLSKTKTNIVLYCAGLLIIKISLLLCRFYYWCIPTYLTAGIIAWINFGIAFNTKPFVPNTLTISTSFYYDQLEPTITDYFVFEAFTVARDYHDKLIPNREDCQELIKLEQIMKERPGLANDFNKDLLFKRFTEKFFSKLNI
ncbi:unnamed protein product [Rotaria sordida]|uniref:RING-type domain-containing protein n=1 Tax=Rotaria sordida TaxID=392033 RepID=A0A815TQX8_9BILA|nr:unnamed protein product [Rotaria sordida]